MKKLNLLFLALMGLFFVACDSNDDTHGDWAKSVEFSGANRVCAVSFTDPKNGDVYIGMGYNSNLTTNADQYMTDFWVYNGAGWKKVPEGDFPQKDKNGKNIGRKGSVAFVIDRIAYVGAGYRGTFAGHTTEEYFSDFYLFDLDKKEWIKEDNGEYKKIDITDFEKNPEECSFADGIAFTHNGKGYVGTGQLKNRVFKTIFCYDPKTGKWSDSNFPGNSRVGAVTFTIDNRTIVCLGAAGSACTDVHLFDGEWHRKEPIADTKGKWNDDYDDIPRSYAIAFAADDRGVTKGFIAGGNKRSCWLYDINRDRWNEVTGFPSAMITRFGAIGFSYGGYGYITTGGSSISTSDDNSTWVFYPGIEEDDNNDY